MFRRMFSAASVRPIIAAVVLAAAPLVVAAPAHALGVSHTVCYRADGTAVFDPPSEDGFAYCVTRPPAGGGGYPLQVCTITTNTVSCSPLVPLQG